MKKKNSEFTSNSKYVLTTKLFKSQAYPECKLKNYGFQPSGCAYF